MLAFTETHDTLFAIHRVWTGSPAQRRQWRLDHGSAQQRHISSGCVNVARDVYDYLLASCGMGCLVTIKEN